MARQILVASCLLAFLIACALPASAQIPIPFQKPKAARIDPAPPPENVLDFPALRWAERHFRDSAGDVRSLKTPSADSLHALLTYCKRYDVPMALALNHLQARYGIVPAQVKRGGGDRLNLTSFHVLESDRLMTVAWDNKGRIHRWVEN